MSFFNRKLELRARAAWMHHMIEFRTSCIGTGTLQLQLPVPQSCACGFASLGVGVGAGVVESGSASTRNSCTPAFDGGAAWCGCITAVR